LAKCKLGTDHPKFLIRGDASDADLQSGLKELQDKLAKDHKLANFFPQPMKGFPQYQNKIWKWDFAPSGQSSAHRKGWRLFAYVPDPQAAEPIPAEAFVCYDKDQEPKGNPAKFLADVLKDFLTSAIAIQATPDRFRRQTLANGKIVSLCYECCETIFSENNEEADGVEASHECRPLPY